MPRRAICSGLRPSMRSPVKVTWPRRGLHEPHQRVAQGGLAHAVPADDRDRFDDPSRSSGGRAPVTTRSPHRARRRGAGVRQPSEAPCQRQRCRGRSRGRAGCGGSRRACPAATMTPSAITTTRSATCSATSMSCSISSSVVCARQRFEQVDQPLAFTTGQPRRRLVEHDECPGRSTTTMPISSWRCWPCDRSPTIVSRRSREPDRCAAVASPLAACSRVRPFRQNERCRPCLAGPGQIEVVLDGEPGNRRVFW